MNLMPDQLDDLTLQEFFHKLNGFTELVSEREKRRFEAARFTAWLVISSMSEKPLKATDIVAFDWEKPKSPHIVPPERYNELQKKWKLQ
jgi:hypothetical protein